MSDIIKGATVFHHGAVSYGRGKVLDLVESDVAPMASVQFDADAGRGPRTVRVAHLSVERALPMAVRLPVAPKLRVVYSRDGAGVVS